MVAYDAKSALSIANTFPPDLLLMDDTVPAGIELALAIKRLAPHCSILICRTNVGARFVENGWSRGGRAYNRHETPSSKRIGCASRKSTAVPNIRKS